MNRILIDLTILTDDEQKKAGYGIKLFKQKKENTELILVGKIDNLLTLDSFQGITIINYKDKEEALEFCFAQVKEKKCDAIVSFRDRLEIAATSNKFLIQKEPSPLYVTSYANAYTGKWTLLGDFGYQTNPSESDYLNYLTERKTILLKFNGRKNPAARFLLPSGLSREESITSVIRERKKDKAYKGEIESLHRLEADSDILIGNPNLVCATISGIEQGITIYNEYLEQGRNASIQYKMGGALIKKLRQKFESSIDKKFTSGGRLLYGFDKPVVIIRKDTAAGGINACLNLADNAANSLK